MSTEAESAYFAREMEMTCPIRNVSCPEHGFIHGKEAEELRQGIERLLEKYPPATGCDNDPKWDRCDLLWDLRKLLDRVDARDSLAWLEARDTTSPARLYCIKNNGYYSHFYPSAAAVRLCGNGPIVAVELTEAPTEAPDTDCFFAWWSAERKIFTFVYRSKESVAICFPGGPEAAERAGHGRRCRVLVKEIEGGEHAAG